VRCDTHECLLYAYPWWWFLSPVFSSSTHWRQHTQHKNRTPTTTQDTEEHNSAEENTNQKRTKGAPTGTNTVQVGKRRKKTKNQSNSQPKQKQRRQHQQQAQLASCWGQATQTKTTGPVASLSMTHTAHGSCMHAACCMLHDATCACPPCMHAVASTPDPPFQGWWQTPDTRCPKTPAVPGCRAATAEARTPPAAEPPLRATLAWAAGGAVAGPGMGARRSCIPSWTNAGGVPAPAASRALWDLGVEV